MALQIVVAPILTRERQKRMLPDSVNGVLAWLDKIHEEVSPGMLRYLAWPIAVATRIRAEICGSLPKRWYREVYLRETGSND
jgi:hypothetical protein